MIWKPNKYFVNRVSILEKQMFKSTCYTSLLPSPRHLFIQSFSVALKTLFTISIQSSCYSFAISSDNLHMRAMLHHDRTEICKLVQSLVLWAVYILHISSDFQSVADMQSQKKKEKSTPQISQKITELYSSPNSSKFLSSSIFEFEHITYTSEVESPQAHCTAQLNRINNYKNIHFS